MLDIYRVSTINVRSIEWNGDPIEYDLNLFNLGHGKDKFLVVNPEMENYISVITEPPNTDKCIVWNYENQWIAKHFTKNWNPEIGYEEITITKPKFIWRKNADLDRTMTFEDDPFGIYEAEPWDWGYELIWYMDPRFNPLDDEVWAISCKPISGKCLGTKNMGYVIPSVNVEINDEIPEIPVDIDSLCPAYWDLAYECAYQLDKKHCPDRNLWVVKFTPAYRKPKEWKWYGIIEPEFEVEYNPDLPEMDYEIDYVIPWHDIGYDHVWNLARCHFQNNEPDIWAFKIITSAESKGVKVIGEVSPEVEFEVNPELSNINYDLEYIVPWHDFQYDHVWTLDSRFLTNGQDSVWAVKMKTAKKSSGDKFVGEISPSLRYSFNPDLPKMEYDIDFVIPHHDMKYEHVWLLDKKHCPGIDHDIWAVKACYCDDPEGTKIVGSVSPKLHITNSPFLPKLDYGIDYTIPFYDFEYEHTWVLDPKHTKKSDEEIWAVSISAVKHPTGSKTMGYVSPDFKIKINDEVREYKFHPSIDDIQYYDFRYVNQYQLAEEYTAGFDIWAVQIYFTENPKGTKIQGPIEPSSFIEYNPDFYYLDFEIDYKIPYHDAEYIHVWYLDPKFTGGEKIWAAKARANKRASGEKEMGVITPLFPEHLDVVFISYGEPNAEENFKRLLAKAPWAKRVKDVKGIFEAHRAAAEIAETDLFYVVDGDAYLTDQFEFDYQPGIFDRDCVYLWHSQNPVNDLVYGYGGIKLFPRDALLKLKHFKTLDLATSFPKIKVIGEVSNITKFNVDEFSTWRSAFRECVKLCYNIDKYPENPSHRLRLQKWLKSEESRDYGVFAKHAAIYAQEFYKENPNPSHLKKINDRDWLLKEFYRFNPHMRTPNGH